MFGAFVVGNPPPPRRHRRRRHPSASAAAAAGSALTRLLASVGPGFTIGVRTPAGARAAGRCARDGAASSSATARASTTSTSRARASTGGRRCRSSAARPGRCASARARTASSATRTRRGCEAASGSPSEIRAQAGGPPSGPPAAMRSWQSRNIDVTMFPVETWKLVAATLAAGSVAACGADAETPPAPALGGPQQSQLLDWIAAHPDQASVLASRRRRRARLAGGRRRGRSRSTFKLAVLAAYAREVAAGRLDPGRARRARADVARWYLQGTDGGAHERALAAIPSRRGTLSLDGVVRAMVEFSDNAATDYLLARLGRDRVRETAGAARARRARRRRRAGHGRAADARGRGARRVRRPPDRAAALARRRRAAPSAPGGWPRATPRRRSGRSRGSRARSRRSPTGTPARARRRVLVARVGARPRGADRGGGSGEALGAGGRRADGPAALLAARGSGARVALRGRSAARTARRPACSRSRASDAQAAGRGRARTGSSCCCSRAWTRPTWQAARDAYPLLASDLVDRPDVVAAVRGAAPGMSSGRADARRARGRGRRAARPGRRARVGAPPRRRLASRGRSSCRCCASCCRTPAGRCVYAGLGPRAAAARSPGRWAAAGSDVLAADRTRSSRLARRARQPGAARHRRRAAARARSPARSSRAGSTSRRPASSTTISASSWRPGVVDQPRTGRVPGSGAPRRSRC